MSELTPLNPAGGGGGKDDTKVIYGYPMHLDDASWQYVMIFPMVDGDKPMPDKKKWTDPVDKPEEKAKKLFKDRLWTGKESVKSKFSGAMTNLQFHEAVRAVIAEVLSGPRCGFKLDTKLSVDGDERLLMIELCEDETIKKLADKQEMRMPVLPSAYPALDEEGRCLPKGEKGVEAGCPTHTYKEGKFVPPKNDEDRNQWVPMYLRYSYDATDQESKDKSKIYGKFEEKDLIRLIRKRMQTFFSLQELEKSGVVVQMYPVHHHAQIETFEKANWSKLSVCSWLSWPGGEDIDNVRTYFGEEVAFFFHWMNFYTRWMMVPGLIGFPLFFRRFLLPLDQQRYCQIGFCLMMIMWSALFTSKYTQRSNLKVLQWGMQNYDQVASIRKEFDPTYRFTKKETVQNSIHWILAIVFMIETVAAVAAINSFRVQAASLEEGETLMGLPGPLCITVGKYMITANIKFVDIAWAKMSPFLTGKENWRTDQQMKNAMVQKLFLVKFVLYYYPFYYIAFVMEHVEGCAEGGKRGCLPMLVENLVIFFITHTCTAAANLVVPSVLTYIKVRGEINAAKAQGKDISNYTYLQLQAKCPPYVGDTQDFMELVLSLGFVMMFSVALPVMASLSLVTNLIEMKFLAYRMMNVQQRAEPRGQEGIGAWAGIIKTVSYVAVMANAGMAVFVMHPIKDLILWKKLSVFIIVEHIAFFSIAIIQGSIPDKASEQGVIEERNGDLMDEVTGDADSKVEVKTTECPKLSAQ